MRIRTSLMAALLAGASLAACQRSQPQVTTLPLDPSAAAPLGEAPPPGGLPPAPPARIATLADYRDAYAYPDRAWNMAWAFGDSAPDYAFDDDGVSPWVWVSDDDSYCLAEPAPGGERYYYFLPGAYTPFYVQDPSFGYGFANGQLAAVYDRAGRQISPSAAPTATAVAGQYLARARSLRQAAADAPHRPVAAANWSARRGMIAAQREAFARSAAADPAWRSYHDQHQGEQSQRLAAEAARREAWAAQTDTRLGAGARAAREQRLAQSFAQGTSRPAMPAAHALPPSPAPRQGRDLRLAEERRPAGHALHEKAPATPRTSASRVAPAPPDIDAASAHATDAAARARAAQPHAFRALPSAAEPAQHAAPQPRAFHAPPSAAAQPAQHAAEPAKPPPPAQAAPPPQAAQGLSSGHGGDRVGRAGHDKHH